MSDDSEPSGPSRRAALLGLSAGGLSLAGLASASGQTPARTDGRVLPSTNVCLLTPHAVEGPFYLDAGLQRADIREGRPGVPLRLLLQVIEAADCAPLKNARVDVWHSDAAGRYSGYPGQGDGGDISTVGQTFLRGTQATDAEGLVRFETIYPGWYRGRTPHIHFRVFVDARSVLTGQLYFPDALSAYIFANVPAYSERSGARDTVNTTDGVLKESGGGHGSFCSIKEDADCYLASLIIGVDRNAKPVAERHPPGPPPGGPRMGGGPPPGGWPPGGPPPGGPPPGGPPPGGPGSPPAMPKGPLVPGLS